MCEDVIVETIPGQLVVGRTVGEPTIPVVPEFLGTEHQDAGTPVLVVFDDGQGFEGFTKADAVREDAPVEIPETPDGGGRSNDSAPGFLWRHEPHVACADIIQIFQCNCIEVDLAVSSTVIRFQFGYGIIRCRLSKAEVPRKR